MAQSPVVITEGLTRQFGEITAVDDLNLTVYAGEVLGFMGHNGAGKTTTVRLLNGVLTPTAGMARVLGFDPSTEGAQLRQRTGVLTETPSVDERLTGYENLSIFGALFQVPEEKLEGRIAELLDLFQLADRADEKVGGYSRGMKQKLALARAILHNPELLFLDEPTSGLDPVMTRQVHNLIRDLSQNRGHTIFLCTHNLEEAQRLCDRVAVLEYGKMVALGTPAELASSLGQGIRLEIETSPDALKAAVASLRGFSGAREVIHSEDHPVITLSLAVRDQVPKLVDHLVSANVPLYRISPQGATLEDVYFALHEKEEVSE